MPLSGVRFRLVEIETEQPVAVVVRSDRRTTLLIDRRFTRGQRIAAALRLLRNDELDRVACRHGVATRCSHDYRSRVFRTVNLGTRSGMDAPPMAVADSA